MRKHALHFKKRGAKFAIPTDVQPGAGRASQGNVSKNVTFFLPSADLGFLQYGKSIHIL